MTLQGDKKRESTGAADLVTCTTCTGAPGTCTHTANNGGVAEVSTHFIHKHTFSSLTTQNPQMNMTHSILDILKRPHVMFCPIQNLCLVLSIGSLFISKFKVLNQQKNIRNHHAHSIT